MLYHPDSVILKLPTGEAESHETTPTTTPVTPGTETTPLADPEPKTSADALELVKE